MSFPDYRRTAEDRMYSVLKFGLWCFLALVVGGIGLMLWILIQVARLVTAL